ncbi:MAG: dihydrofolate reductase family protein [Rhizobiaceae bacterium]|nr:dihydrofolate reductase family protein [Rhizobiaceae bacterium]
MQPLIYSVNVTLDGCYDHRSVTPDEASHRGATELIASADALLFGRVTYQMMEEAWRPVAETGARPDWMPAWMEPFARTIHRAKKYVVSSTLPQADWNAEIVRDDLEATVRALKQQAGRGIFVGGVKLAQSLTELGLIDEYVFFVHPRIVGRGPTLFAGLSRPVDLKLVDRSELPSGALVLRYGAAR